MKKQEQVFTIEAITAKRPYLTLKQALAWNYYFDNGWACIKTSEGCYVVMDESCFLNEAMIFPDEDSLLAWLDSSADEQISDDPLGFFGSMFGIPAADYNVLLTEEVLDAMVRAVDVNVDREE